MMGFLVLYIPDNAVNINGLSYPAGVFNIRERVFIRLVNRKMYLVRKCPVGTNDG